MLKKFMLKCRNALIIGLLILISIISVLSVINVFTSLGHKTYTNSLVAVGTILLALLTGISVQAVIEENDERRKSLLNEINTNHLNNIKRNILDPMKTLVNDNYYTHSMFEILDQQRFSSKLIQQILKLSSHNWDDNMIHSANYKGIINDKLYKDLENHKITKGIDIEFEEILDLIINKSRSYSEKLSELYDKVAGLEDVKNLIMRVKQKHENDNNDYRGDYIRLIIVLSLGYDIESNFQNYFKMANDDGEYANVDRIVNTLKNNDDEVSEASSLRNEIKTKVEAFIKRINEINSIDLLDDDCEELKRQRNIMHL